MTHAHVMLGFREYHRRWVLRAQMIVATHARQNNQLVQQGLDLLDNLGLEVADKIDETRQGKWPEEVLKILGQTMKELVLLANQLKQFKKSLPFDYHDLSREASYDSSSIAIWN